MRKYRIYFNLNISTIRSLLKRINKLKLSSIDRKRCKKFDVEMEQKLAEKEIENSNEGIKYYLT